MSANRLFSPLACFLLAAAAPMALVAETRIFITVGPPPIPFYDQPECPTDGYLWAPGYWSWGGEGYFWVPGTWVRPPEIGLLWTPGYWGWGGQVFVFHSGYWGSHVGFYGGINYGYGYDGFGFEGGRWQGRTYAYNRAVSNVNPTRSRNVYSQPVSRNNEMRVAYNGGRGGVNASPSPQERRAGGERHLRSTSEQAQHHQGASRNRELLASVNRGKPSVAASARPSDFSHGNIRPAKAPGGHVDEAALRAHSKPAPTPPKASATGARPGPATRPEARGRVPLPAHPDRYPGKPLPQEPPKNQDAPRERPGGWPRPVPVPRQNPAPRLEPTPPRRIEPPRPDRPEAPSPRPAPRPAPQPRPMPEPQPKPLQPGERGEHPRRKSRVALAGGLQPGTRGWSTTGLESSFR